MRPPIQGKSTRIPTIEDLPSTSRGVPTMVFTGTKEVETAPIKDKGIRLKENIQIVPPGGSWKPWPVSYSNILQKTQQDETHDYRSTSQLPRYPSQSNQEWTTVGKNGKPIRKETPKTDKQQKSRVKKEKKRLPKTAAVSIKGSSKEFFYADALKRVRTNISLKDLNPGS